MKRIIYPILALSIAMFACSVPTTVTPQLPVVTEPPVATQLPVVTNMPVVTNTLVVTEPPVPTNFTCNKLALYLDPALASGYNCETVPESAEGMEVYPQYTNLTLQGYVLSDKFFTPHISIYPVQRYSELLPDFMPGRVSDLQALIGGSPAPVFTASFSSSLPFLPVFNAAQIFFAGYQVVPCKSGSGIRFLTEYAQDYAPVNNTDLFYTYQGLTSDGQYWVSAILPINNPILPANADNPPGGVSWEEFSNNFEPYITNMINQLNSQTSDSYTPTLTSLDALVASITIQP
ncbi:MAG: hypothetical protein NTW99_06155 [Chloroflexi bacterium]|nr:hypothetical protein [Chloroflexota bacterium]